MTRNKVPEPADRLRKYKALIAAGANMTATEWDDHERLLKNLDPEGYKVYCAERTRNVRMQQARELSTTDLLALLVEREDAYVSSEMGAAAQAYMREITRDRFGNPIVGDVWLPGTFLFEDMFRRMLKAGAEAAPAPVAN